MIDFLKFYYSGIYGGFARSCYAVTDNNNTHLVTDENGCATDPAIFGQWNQDENQVQVASFNAFKFPASDNIRFQCNIRVCFGRCQPVSFSILIFSNNNSLQLFYIQVNCDGVDAFGRRRRRQAELPPVVPSPNRNASAVEIRESVIAGQLREEIMVQSNSILALDRGGEERFSAPTEGIEFENYRHILYGTNLNILNKQHPMLYEKKFASRRWVLSSHSSSPPCWL